MQKKLFDFHIMQTVFSFLCPRKSKTNFRRFFMRKFLLGAPYTYSPFFNLFTFAGNRDAGNISDHEDIVDRIVDYSID